MVKFRLRELAEKKGITTAYQLQQRTGALPGQAYRWWNTEPKQINLEHLDKLCQALDCDVCDIIHFEPEPPHRPPSPKK